MTPGDLIAAILGAIAVGVVVMLIVAPRSERLLRDRMTDRSSDADEDETTG